MQVDLNNFEQVENLVKDAEENKKNVRTLIRSIRNLDFEETSYDVDDTGFLTDEAIEKLNEKIRDCKPYVFGEEESEHEDEDNKITNEDVALYLLEKGCTYRDLYLDDSTDLELAANILHSGHGKVLYKFACSLKKKKITEIATQLFFYRALNTNLLDILYEFVDKNEEYFYDAMSSIINEEDKNNLLLYYVNKFLDIVKTPVDYIENESTWDFIVFAISSSGNIELLQKFFSKNIRVPFEEFIHSTGESFDAFTIAFYSGRVDICKLLLQKGYLTKESFVPRFAPHVSASEKEELQNIL